MRARTGLRRRCRTRPPAFCWRLGPGPGGVIQPAAMPDDARIQAAISGAERFVNAWHGRSMRERLWEVADATGEDERADGYGTGERIQRLEGRIAEILGA